MTNDLPGDDEENPFEALFAAMRGPMPTEAFGLGAILSQLGAMMQSTEPGTVPRDVVQRAVDEKMVGVTDPAPTTADRSRFDDAVLLADAWLDQATSLPSHGELEVWSRRQWIDKTARQWLLLVQPLASRATDAMGPRALMNSDSFPPEFAAVVDGPMGQLMDNLGSIIFATQVGQGLAELSGSVLTTADIGVCVTEDSRAALVLTNLEGFSEDLGVTSTDIDLYLTLRARAHQRLAAHAPWLTALFTAAIDDYARGLSLDLSVLQEQIEALNPNDPEALSESLASGVFAPPETQEQLDAQARLETLIALIDGWIDDVVTQASLAMPSAVALRETLQRRRATGGPAEQTFASLVGLELRPRRVREASQLWTKIREQRGVAGRDALWAHPDLLPTGEDIDSPGKFLGAIPLDLSELDDLKPFEDNEN